MAVSGSRSVGRARAGPSPPPPSRPVPAPRARTAADASGGATPLGYDAALPAGTVIVTPIRRPTLPAPPRTTRRVPAGVLAAGADGERFHEIDAQKRAELAERGGCVRVLTA